MSPTHETTNSAGTFQTDRDEIPIQPRLAVKKVYEVTNKAKADLTVDEGQNLGKELDRWIERTLHSDTPPEGDRKYLTLHLTDTEGYHRTVYKYETDMLWPEVDRYAQARGAKTYVMDQFELLCNGDTIDPFKPIEQQGVCDGDTIKFFRGNFGFVQGFQGGTALKMHPMLLLSPMDSNGKIYGSFRGERTRQDEVSLILNLFLRPDRHSTRIKTRVLNRVRVKDLLEALEDWTMCPAMALRPLHHGSRMDLDSLISNSAIKGKIELDVYGEQVGGAPKPMFSNEELLLKPTKEIRSPAIIKVKGLQGSLNGVIYSEGSGTVRALLKFLEDHTRVFLDCYQDGVLVDPSEDLWFHKVIRTKNNVPTIEVEVRERHQMLDYHPSLAFRGHFWATQVKVEIDGIPIRDAVFMPFGAKLSSWVRQQATYQRPEIYLGGKLLRGDLLVDQLPITIGNEIRINTRPKMDWVRYNGPSFPTRYREEAYEGPDHVHNEGYIRLEFKLEESAFLIHTPPNLPFRVIVDFLYEEFGAIVSLTKNGHYLVDQTPFSMSMTDSVRLNASLVAKEPNSRKFFQTMRLFCTFFNGKALGYGVHGVLAPCSSTLDQVIAHQLPSFGRGRKLRFLADGERLPNNTEICTLDVEEDGHVDVEPEQEGGGPSGSQGSQDTNPPQEGLAEDTPESVQPSRFVAEGSTGAKRKEPAPNLPHMTFGSLPPATNFSDRTYAGTPGRGNPGMTTQFASSSQAFGMSQGQGYTQPHGYSQPSQGSAHTGTGYGQPPAPEEFGPTGASLPRPAVFCGKGVTNFFEKYEAWCNRYKQSSQSRFQLLCFFLSEESPHDVLSYAKKLPAWERKDYEGVKADLLRTFHEPEDRYMLSDLTILAERQASEEIDDLGTLISFSFKFKEIANTLVKFNKITDQQYRDTYMIGLGRRLRERMLRRSHQTRTREINPSFETIEEDARRVFEPDTYYERFENRQAQEEARLRNPDWAPMPTMQVASSKTKDDATTVKELADVFKNLMVNLGQAVVGGTGQGQIPLNQNYGSRYRSYNASTGDLPAIGYSGRDNNERRGDSRPVTPQGPPPATPYRGDPNRQQMTRAASPAGCHYCGNLGHSRRDCRDFLQHKKDGLVSENAQGKMIGPDGGILPWHPGDMKNIVLQHAAGGGKTRGYSNAGEYYHAHAMEYEGFNDYPDHHRQEGYDSYNALGEVNEKRTADDDGNGAVPKRSRRGPGHVTLPINTAPSVPTPRVEEIMDEDQPADTPKEKKHKYTYMSEVQKNFNTRAAIDRLLNKSQVSFSVAEALSLNPDLARGVTQAASRKKTPYFGPLESNNAELATGQEGGPFYTHSLAMIKIKLDGQELMAMLDSGSELDMISPEAAAKAQLPVRYDGDHRVRGINGAKADKLGGICEHAPLTIGGITRTVHLFIKPMNYQVLLGMPTIRRFQIQQGHDKEGRPCINMKDPNGVKVRVYTANGQGLTRTYIPPNAGREPRRDEVEYSESESDDE
ncbi:hypothetical protein OC846_006475 [Tilletia horrida]|uniref:CCHC-type domain-containing protein n=1 Tax=Tilletia horrida TaxID=155126 RepID=A0AAN6GL98_9BASI|nr:hypothetical protein OC846_006475 [Tilletia horrida]KAK0559736.1 hypothetical protein OC861_006547 [Tilletia horrida]